MSRASLSEHIIDAIKLSGTKERLSGVVAGYDTTGTTIFVLAEDGRQLLAFADPMNPIKSGDQVSFRVDGMSAKDVLKEIPADL
jgi:hypothetical protein